MRIKNIAVIIIVIIFSILILISIDYDRRKQEYIQFIRCNYRNGNLITNTEGISICKTPEK